AAASRRMVRVEEERLSDGDTKRKHSAISIQHSVNKRDRGSVPLLVWSSNLLRFHYIILEVAGAVGFRPATDLAGDGRTKKGIVRREQIRVGRAAVASGTGLTAKCVFQSESAVEPGFEVGTVDCHLQFMPGIAIEHEGLGAVAELYRTTNAVVE